MEKLAGNFSRTTDSPASTIAEETSQMAIDDSGSGTRSASPSSRPGNTDARSSFIFLLESHKRAANEEKSHPKVFMAIARNLCVCVWGGGGEQARGALETPVSRGVWGHAPPENVET